MAAPRKTHIPLWPPLHLLLPAILVLIQPLSHKAASTGFADASSLAPGSSKYLIAVFENPRNNGSFQHMVVSDQHHDVFIGSVNYLYSLDKDLNLKTEVKIGPVLDNPKCPPPVDGHRYCSYDLKYTQNVNKILVIDKVDERLIACGTLYHGYCEKRDLSDISNLDPPAYDIPVAGNSATSSTAAFIAPGPLKGAQNVLYVSVTWSKQEGILEDIPAVSSRNLQNFSLAYKDPISFTSTSFNFEGQQRAQFRVKYIYGFSSENFSYMLTVQRTLPESNIYHSVAIRVCHSDLHYYTYTEVPLYCRSGNVDYNILRAAYKTKPGRNLAMALGINTQTDVLFAVFSKGESGSSNPTNESALCMYPVKYVSQQFLKNIEKCFIGIGNTGGGHLGSSKKCNNYTYESSDPNYDSFCGKGSSGLNSPLVGSDPIVREPTLIFPPSTTPRLTAMKVTVAHNYTVAFVGTEKGSVIKVAIESDKSANIYETVPVLKNQAIMRDMSFDDDQDHLYLLTKEKVAKIRIHNCSQHTSCSQCLAAQDPYCGWCSLESKCNQRDACKESHLSSRWLPHSGQNCPNINKIVPNQIQRDKDRENHRLLTLDIQHLPDFQQHSTYQCEFTPINNQEADPLTTLATRTGNDFQCNTPKMNQLPPFDAGKDSLAMKLSVLMDHQELVYDTVTFFDCNVHSSCTACTMSQFACTWCIKKHLCTDNTDQDCDTDILITGMNRSGSSVSPGPEFCPKFENSASGTEILVPSGSLKDIVVKATALQPFQLDNLKCRFNLNMVRDVPATVKAVKDREYEISCQEVEFSYLRNKEMQNVPLQIVWGPVDHPLDNPRGILVVMYKCSIMASTCGDCFTIDPKFKCGWCNGNHCTTKKFCQGSAEGFQEKGDVCQNPKIMEFFPKSGPVEGGTLVTIHGQNLGSRIEEVAVKIGFVTCNVTTFKAPNTITCETEESTTNLQDLVRVIIGQGAGNQAHVTTESNEKFSFVQPRLTDISPIIGPYAGGTLLTLKGEHLDAGSQISVLIDVYPCNNPASINTSAITCITSAAVSPSTQPLSVSMTIDKASLQATGVEFKYLPNPNVTGVSRKVVMRSGGLPINVSGENLQNVQSPQMLIWFGGKAYSSPCKFNPLHITNMTCLSPLVSDLAVSFNGYLELEFGFKMDGVKHLQKLTSMGKMKVYPDPVLEEYKDREKVHQKSHEILFINGKNLEPLKKEDIKVHIGKGECIVTSVISPVITCKPPSTPPAALAGSEFPEVVVEIGQNLTYNLGVLRYEQQEDLSQGAIFGIVGGVAALVLIIVIFCIVCLIKFRRNDDMMKKMRKEMDQLESRVANECKEAFAELQTDMSELTSDLSGGGSIPFWDYRTYCMRVLFPPECNDHPVIRELELDYRHREDTERGLKLFFNLIRNKTFLLIFIRTLESNKEFTMRERVNVASLISVSLQTQMEYATEILKTLLAELIEKTVENPKVHPQLLLRRNESVAEKMLTNWFTFLLYKFLKECAGEPLFMLYGAIKQQVSKGPVDAVTSEARYSLSEDKLIRQHINFKHMALYVMDIDVDRCSQPAHPVKVLDCDTISQVKEKILDAIFKSASFSSRPKKEELDLVLFDHPPEWVSGDKSQVPLKMFPNKDTKRLVLSDEDHTTKSDGDCKRLNTLSHYKVPDGAYVALHPKQTSIYNMSIMSEKSKYSSDNSYYNRSPSLNRPTVNIDVEGCKVYHLVRHQDAESNNKEGDRGSKMVSEIYLPRLLVTKGTLQSFVDELLENIFSTAHRGTALPLAIKYMFDFLDDQALHHGMGDDVVHTWKSNSLPLRYWVNVIKNPNFAFDIYKSNIVDACLTVIGQTFMDCCSTQEHKLTKESPSGKLLYAKDIPKYKQWVARYYQDIKIMPAISDQDMTAMLAEESRTHQNEFNTNAALLELYKYVKKYYDDIVNALEDDEFAKKSKLTYKLDQVSAAMDGTTVC